MLKWLTFRKKTDSTTGLFGFFLSVQGEKELKQQGWDTQDTEGAGARRGGGQETKYVSCPRSRTPPYVRSPLVIKVLSEILTGKGEQGMGGGLENADAAQFSAFCTL